MKQELEKSEQVAMQELQHLDGDTERLTAEQSSVEGQKRMKEWELGKFNTELNSHMSSLSMNRKALETYRRNLRSAEDTLVRMQRKRDKAQTIQDIGFGIMLIPVVGTIVGQ